MIEYRLIAEEPDSRIAASEAEGVKHHRLTIDDNTQQILIDEYFLPQNKLAAKTEYEYHKSGETELTVKRVYNARLEYQGQMCIFITAGQTRVQVYDKDNKLTRTLEGLFEEITNDRDAEHRSTR